MDIPTASVAARCRRFIANAGLWLRSVATGGLPHANYYSLADARNTATPAQSGPRAAVTGPTLIVSPPHAAAGFDSQRIMYLRQADQLEYFAHNEWIDTPARMLAP